MKILLISSEPLNDQDLISSCFELSQSQALIEVGVDARILSVQSHYTVFQVFKSFLKKMVPLGQNTLSNSLTIRELGVLMLSRFRRTVLLKKHLIEGVTVYESIKCFGRSSSDLINDWVTTGMYGLRMIQKVEGFLPDLNHAHSRFLKAPALALKAKLDIGVPYLITEHSSRYFDNVISSEESSVMHECLKESSFNIAVSESLKKVMSKMFGESIHMSVLPNCVDRIYNTEPIKDPKNSDVFTFLTVGILDQRKNQELIINAFARLFKGNTKVLLKIAGSGGYELKLKKIVEKEGLQDQVIFLGSLTKKEVKDQMMDCDIFILASLFESFGVVLIEALACGKPVISTKSFGPMEIVNENNGIFVENTIDSMAEAMSKMLETTSDYSAELIREQCLSKYGSASIALGLKSIYSSLIK